MSLTNIENADGLDEADRETVEQLAAELRKRAAKNAKLTRYYESKQPTPSIGIDNIPDTVNVPARCDWANKAVTSVSERVRMDGFTFNGG